jgi:hypothetical protein
MKSPLPVTERLRRSQRDREAFRRRHLARRAQSRFRRDLALVPHVFLDAECVRVASLKRTPAEVLEVLRGRAVWTLDTAARLASGRGLLGQRDLTGYLTAEAMRRAVEENLIGAPIAAPVSVDPLLPRPAALIVHLLDELPPFLELPAGDRVVTWDLLQRDILGTLGWRADLLARLEGAYPGSGEEARSLRS